MGGAGESAEYLPGLVGVVRITDNLTIQTDDGVRPQDDALVELVGNPTGLRVSQRRHEHSGVPVTYRFLSQFGRAHLEFESCFGQELSPTRRGTSQN